MLVYGDHRELADPEQRAREIDRLLGNIETMPPGLDRHARLVEALVETGRLLQGLADDAFADLQIDRRTQAADELMTDLVAIAQAVRRSWDSGFQELGSLPRLQPRGEWPAELELRVPEGFAFYAVYPEAYVEAARRLTLSGAARVIGIRSIGTSLAAVVAAALDAPAPITVRPFGDPSAREIALDAALERELLGGDPHYVIVDEGPGQSGSSFGAVVDWLQAHGVPIERIALLPSHGGAPGPAATEQRRCWWRKVQRRAGEFEQRWPELIAQWCSASLGPLDGPPLDVSGGEWRRLHYAREDRWPAVVPSWERRKFLVTAGGERFLVKFAGLGRTGQDNLAIAQSLHADGFVPRPVGLAHGFLIERWCDDAAPLDPDEKPLAEIARYFGTRAKLLPAPSGSGASADELLAMIRRNASLEFGDDAAHACDHWCERTHELERRMVRVRTDSKLDRHEWLRHRSGALIKTDALDHHRSHDLIGCQDLAWDCAAAIVEFDVDQAAAERFIAVVGDWADWKVDAELLQFYRAAYLAFRLGQSRLGETATFDAAEQQRVRSRGDSYAAELRHLLESTRAPKPLGSSVG